VGGKTGLLLKIDDILQRRRSRRRGRGGRSERE